MDPFTFRPVLDGLEDRHVPSTVTPQQVFVAYQTTVASTDILHGILDTLSLGRTAQGIQNVQRLLPAIVSGSQTNAAVLNAFLGDIRAQLAANPSQAGTLDPLAAKVQNAIVQAEVNGAYASFLEPGFGISPPPPPPPPPPTDTPPNFGTVPTTPPGITTTNPAGSTLPFSLSDPSWQNLASGVRTWDVTPGTGATAQAGHQVSFTYTGYLLNGTVFDSTAANGGKPLTAVLSTQGSGGVTGLIEGMVNGIQGMQVGGTRRIQIPADQGYGAAGNGSVPPNAELVFEVNLVSAS
jgi:hypothetical protein